MDKWLPIERAPKDGTEIFVSSTLDGKFFKKPEFVRWHREIGKFMRFKKEGWMIRTACRGSKGATWLKYSPSCWKPVSGTSIE